MVAFGLGCVLGDLLLLRIRPPHALLTGGIALILASSQAAVVGTLAASLGTQETLLGMSAVGIACALCFLAVPSVRRLPRIEAAVADQ